MQHWLQQLVFGLLPGKCLLCEAGTHRNFDLCAACEADLPRIPNPCPVCALPMTGPLEACLQCALTPPPWHRCFAGFAYNWPTDRLINDFKNHGHLLGGKLLARLVAQAYLQHTPQETLPDLLLPVPLHKRRLRERGFNQSLEIADVISDVTRVPVDSHLCRRVKQGAEQKTLTARQRRRNLRGAFVLDRRLGGEKLAIVDDVLTTGSTVSELTRLLMSGGAGRVEVIALARTPLR